MLICSLPMCEEKAKYKFVLECEKFEHGLFYCENHRPLSYEFQSLTDKQVLDVMIEMKALEKY